MSSSPAHRSAAALAAALVLAGAAPAAAAPRSLDVVNLGDSYSAAVGTGGTSESPLLPGCYQGTGPDHVDRLDRLGRFEVTLDAACSGATTSTIREIASSGVVRAALAEAELVTLTLGGNDVLWGDTITACSAPLEAVTGPGPCDALLAQAPALISAAAGSAALTVETIAAATDATIVVLGYPRLFEAGQDTPLVSAERAAQLNALTDQLNAALESAVEAEGAVFVDVASRFDGHGIGSPAPWINADPADRLNVLHPTSRGYLSGYFTALMSSLSPGQLTR